MSEKNELNHQQEKAGKKQANVDHSWRSSSKVKVSDRGRRMLWS